jgi:hypothetical protein
MEKYWEIQEWEKSQFSADFKSYEEHQRFLGFLLKYQREKNEEYKSERAKYKYYEQFKQDFLIPLFLKTHNS